MHSSKRFLQAKLPNADTCVGIWWGSQLQKYFAGYIRTVSGWRVQPEFFQHRTRAGIHLGTCYPSDPDTSSLWFLAEMHNGRSDRCEDVREGGVMGPMAGWQAQFNEREVTACSAPPILDLHCVAKIKFLCLCSPTWHIWFHLELLWWFE